jgi:hypothetical protein
VIRHSAFDLLAVVTAAAVFYFLPLPQSSVGQPWRLHPTYVSFASLGMITGALVAGTGNLLLSGFYGNSSSRTARLSVHSTCFT